MPSSPFLLTIAIPTFNRVHSLDRLLQALSQESHGEAQVELIVSDNASTDGTGALIERYKQNGVRIRYLRNQTNIGADRNIIQCFESAGGKYVWIFSDDDLMAPGSVRRIIHAISQNDYDLLLVTPRFCKSECAETKEFSQTSDIEFTSAADLARRIHVLFTFISGVVVNKETVSRAPHREFSSLYDTSLAQLGPFFTALNRHRKSLLIRDPLIAATANRNVGYALYKVFGTNLVRIANEWLDDHSVRSAIFNGTIQRFLPNWIVRSRNLRASSVEEDPHRILSSCYGKYSRYWIFDFPLCVLPMPLAQTWLLFVRVLNKIEAICISTI